MKKQSASRARRKIAPATFIAATHSLAARAYLEIRNQILKGELPVGMALSRRTLATELNISVPPVSEALQRLEREGLTHRMFEWLRAIRFMTRKVGKPPALTRMVCSPLWLMTRMAGRTSLWTNITGRAAGFMTRAAT